MFKKKCFSVISIALMSSISHSAEWSDWLTIQRVNLHPSWGVRVETLEDVSSSCSFKIVEWVYSDNDVFMGRIVSSLLAAKFAQAKARFYITTCNNGMAQVVQTQIE